MKMWSINVMILLLFCYACLATRNGSVYFVSRDFDNVLHWDSVEPAFPGEKVLYNVEYWSDAKDQPFQIKQECQNITVLSCNLTAETPSVYDVHYRAQVFANGRLLGRTVSFKPLADTILSPPILVKYTTKSALHVKVTLPLGPDGVSIANIITGSKHGSSKAVPLYTLKITHPEWAVQVCEDGTGEFVISMRKNQTEYCGYVVYKLSAEYGRSESEKVLFCETVPDDPLMLVCWLLVSAAVLTALVIISVVCACNYVKGGKLNSMPHALQTTSRTHKVLQFPDRNLIISEPVVCTKSDRTVYPTIPMKPNVPSPGSAGYSPQDIPCHPWQGSTGSSVDTSAHSATPHLEDTSAQSSESYSAVAVHVPDEENENFQQATTEHRATSHSPVLYSAVSCDNSGMSPKLTSCREPALPDPDTYEGNPARQLLLHTVRDTDGQLVLPLLTLQLQSITGDTVSPLNPERKLLLSDLIDSADRSSLTSFQNQDSSEWSDSECNDSTVNTPTHPYCNTHYSPSQTVVPDFHQGCQSTPGDALTESGYKQNWMPEILCWSESTDSCEYRRTNYPWTWTGPEMEEEGEEDGGVETSRQIILGSWTVQIQE